MIASPEKDITCQLSIRVKVYSTDVCKEDVLKDEEGVMELDKKLVKKLATVADGRHNIRMDYQIIKK